MVGDGGGDTVVLPSARKQGKTAREKGKSAGGSRRDAKRLGAKSVARGKGRRPSVGVRLFSIEQAMRREKEKRRDKTKTQGGEKRLTTEVHLQLWRE